MKVVINECFGGFSLSHKAFLELREMGNKHALEEPDTGELYKDGSGPRDGMFDCFCRYIPRDDPQLVEIVTKLGKEANGACAKLQIVEIPDGIEWQVEEYDGSEHIAEKHRTWP
jgi:hypothetical protein